MVITSTWLMMLVQAIPFWAMLAMTFINFKIKKRFFCISNLALLYITLAMFGSIFMVLRPRTGWPYVRLDAMLFLTVCFILLTLPALFFKDGKKDDHIEFTDLPDKAVLKISIGLIILTVPASVMSAIIAIPDMINFFRMGGDRGAFRDQLVDYGGGFSSLPQFLIQFGLSFGLIALFWLIYCIIFNKVDRWRTILLAIGAMGPCVASLRIVNRSILLFNFFLVAIILFLLFGFIPEKRRKQTKRYVIVIVTILLIPFMAITIARFKSDIVYSIGSYFSTGPYSFNANFAARSEGGIKPLNGYLNIGWPQFIYDKLFGTDYYKKAEMYYDNYYYAGDAKRGTSPEVDLAYRSISGAYSSEFSTAIGCFIKDFHFAAVLGIVLLFSIFFSIYYYYSKRTISQVFVSAFFFYFLFQSSMFNQLKMKNGFFQIFLIAAFAIFLNLIQRKCTDCNAENFR